MKTLEDVECCVSSLASRMEAFPVILVVYDAQVNVAYWLYIQAHLRKRKA
jgi:hypothetical protein